MKNALIFIVRARVSRFGLTVLMVFSTIGAALTVQAAPDPAPVLSWADVSPVARFRSQADWLVDIGARTADQVYGPFKGKAYKEGNTENFYALDFGSNQNPPRRLRATLKLITDHAYWWFEDGTDAPADALAAAGKRFEDDIYPLDHKLFGEEWTPGIDADPHMFILHQKKIGGYAVGVFSSRDECAKAVCPGSNQHEMLYIGLDYGPVNSSQQLTVISHELQHLIQYNTDGNEERWLDEGLAQLAEHLNGFNPRYIASSNLRDYLHNPNFQLNSWPASQDIDPSINYAAGYIFSVYLFQRFGTEFIQYLARSPYKGLASVEESLKAMKTGVTLDQVFTDWTIANYVNSPYVGDGRYYYQSLKLPQRADPRDLTADQPQRDSLHEYGADYFLLSTAGDYKLSFRGEKMVRLTDARPPSGKWMWWGFNAPRGAARLERELDLSGSSGATLTYKAWWDIDTDRDLAHVLVSKDDGKSWDVVEASGTHKCRLGGECYDGKSQSWSDETVDLSPYDGQKIRVRFEYLTQNLVPGQGFLIDDIHVEAINFADDVESGVGDWQAQGFIRVNQTVPQHYAVNAITRTQPPQVIPMTIDANNVGALDLKVPQEGAVIVVGGMAPFVHATSNFTITARQQ